MPDVYTEGAASMEQLTNLVISDRDLATISSVLVRLMNDTNAASIMLIDKSGQVVAVQGGSTKRNATTLGALLAGVFSSSREVAKLLDEKHFRNIFQQGVQQNIYTSMVEEVGLLVIIFAASTHIRLVNLISKQASPYLLPILP